MTPSELGKSLVEPDRQLYQDMESSGSAAARFLREEVRAARGIARVRLAFELVLFGLLTRPRFMHRIAKW